MGVWTARLAPLCVQLGRADPRHCGQICVSPVRLPHGSLDPLSWLLCGGSQTRAMVSHPHVVYGRRVRPCEGQRCMYALGACDRGTFSGHALGVATHSAESPAGGLHHLFSGATTSAIFGQVRHTTLFWNARLGMWWGGSLAGARHGSLAQTSRRRPPGGPTSPGRAAPARGATGRVGISRERGRPTSTLDRLKIGPGSALDGSWIG